MDIQVTPEEVGGLTIIIRKWLQQNLESLGIHQDWIIWVKLLIIILMVVIATLLLQFIARKVLEFVFQRVEKIIKLSFIKYAIKNKLPHYLALIIPYSFVRSVIPFAFYDFKSMISPCIKIVDIYMVFMVIWIIMAIIKSGFNVLQERPAFHNKPIKSYLQVIQIILFIFGAVGIFSIITGKSATAIFAAMGAASAVMMLLFKDSIMGFVGSIQISTNDMVRLGDWITMNKYGADGDVLEINLTTVKVRNFDKTITTIPTYALISDSFQNWRGMKDAGGRRFKRCLYLKQSEIRQVTPEELERYKKIDSLKEFIETKEKEYAERNKGIDMSIPINGHWLTNNDLFMAYATQYLRSHPRIAQDMTLLVRQLAPTPQGLPIEIYTFTNTTVWADYENTLSEILNHLISAVKFFNIRLLEEVSSSDSLTVNLNNLN